MSAIEAVPPGTLYDSRDGWRQWYRIPQGAARAEPGLDIDATARELRLVIEAAVAKWMVADVEVGSFLSGGLDSSIIAAIAQRQLKQAGRGMPVVRIERIVAGVVTNRFETRADSAFAYHEFGSNMRAR